MPVGFAVLKTRVFLNPGNFLISHCLKYHRYLHMHHVQMKMWRAVLHLTLSTEFAKICWNLFFKIIYHAYFYEKPYVN